MAIGNMSAVDLAKQRAEQQQGGGNAVFFSLKEGERAHLRFLTGMVDSHVISHSCGLNLYDFPTRKWDDIVTAGQQPLCPNCNQPLTEADIQFDRSEHMIADLHNYFPTSEADKRASFVCLASEVNASRGWVPADPNGNPLYQCPACSCTFNRNKDTGQPKKPTMRLYGIAVVRDVVYSQQMVNGVMVKTATDVRDVMVEENGQVHPKIVVVQMSWTNFWSKLASFDSSYEQSICMYDWSIIRSGSGLSTSYDIQRASNTPSVVDPRQYEEWMPDIAKLLQGQGNPSYYVKKGYQVPGYVPPEQAQQNAAGTAQAAIQNAAMGVPQQQYQQPMQPAQQYQGGIPQAAPMQETPQPQPMPQVAQGGSNDWSVVQNQFA